ncbi:hypothetical protein [Sulfurimonas sp. HSL3-2]|uniref:DUF4139 domain-containing protein n=1 Tax=Hydrocurvibacter mobilis TaxID=3131936 RepID=UPI0031F77AEB
MKKLLILYTLGSSLLFGSTISNEPLSTSLVVYNSNLALVHEKRELYLDKDRSTIIYNGVASNIITDSVNISLPSSVTLFSQQYRYDKLELSKLLQKNIGEEVRYEEDKAILLSFNGQNAIVKNERGHIYSVDAKKLAFLSIPSTLILKPSLVWNLYSPKKMKQDISVDYLVRGISWKSDYILRVANDKADLTGWITIDNRSGKPYVDSKLSVLAGDVAVNTPVYKQRAYDMLAEKAAPMTDVTTAPLQGYHIYSIPFKVTLADNEKTQIKFIQKNNILIEKLYSAMMSHPDYLSQKREHQVDQTITFKNKDYELPKGVIRTYTKFQDDTVFTGEANIAHTPKNDTVKVTIGKAFDIKASESIVKRTSTKTYLDEELLYSIKNSTDKTKTVTLKVPFVKNENAKVITSQPHSFKDGYIIFDVHVKANNEEKFKVRYEIKRY